MGIDDCLKKVECVFRGKTGDKSAFPPFPGIGVDISILGGMGVLL